MDVKMEAERAAAAGVDAPEAQRVPTQGADGPEDERAVAGAKEPEAPGVEVPPPDRPRSKAAQREATMGALIGAARALFAERGYAGVGTEEIVQQAGVTRGALYHHFRGGKEELFRAVLIQLSAETVQRVGQAAAATDDPWEELVLGSEAFLDACATPEVQRIVLLDAPSVLGWDVRRAIDADYGLRLLEGAIDEAAMVVARAEDPAAARAEMSVTIRRLLEGLRAPTV
jgi:AcrR family transcriptional regulator